MIFSKVLSFKNQFFSKNVKETMINLLDKTFVIPESYRAFVIKITPQYVARPDLLSYQLYGDESYADVLMKINGISNPYELNEGMYLVAPSLSNLPDFVCRPSTKWQESKYENNVQIQAKPQTKSKNEKRKPNEAVTGDSRYNIDKVSKIVIY